MAATFNGNKITLYINGEKDKTTGFQGTIEAHRADYETTIGQWACRNNIYRRFNGAIDEASLWSKALNENEIEEFMPNIFFSAVIY